MATKYTGQVALNKLMQLIKTALSGKLDKTGGTITGNLKVNGDFEPVKGLTTSGGVYAQTVSTPVLALHDNGAAGANASINVAGANAVEVTVPDGDKRAKARMKVGTPTEDDDAVTKKYADAGLDGKLDKTGGTITGSLEINNGVHAGGAVQSDLLLSAPSVTVYDDASEASVHINCSGDNAARITSLGSDGKSHYSRFAVGTPTGDNDATTKAYVDSKVAAGGVTVDSAMSASSTNPVQNKVIKSYVDNKVSGFQTASQVQDAIKSAVSGVYTPKGSIAFASLPVPVAGKVGWVYNITDAFTTDSNFVEGEGFEYPAGTNVVCAEISAGDYGWDVLAGIIDLTELTATEVQTLWDSV